MSTMPVWRGINSLFSNASTNLDTNSNTTLSTFLNNTSAPSEKEVLTLLDNLTTINSTLTNSSQINVLQSITSYLETYKLGATSVQVEP